MNVYYYPKTLSGITIALLDLFNDIIVKKYNAAGDVVDIIDVPIQFGPIDKTYTDRKRQEDSKHFYLQVPRMSLVFTGLGIAEERAAALNEERYWLDAEVNLSGSDTLFSDLNPVPYNYFFTLYIRTDSMNDFSQILENTLPYFAPDQHLRVKEFSFLNVERDLTVKISNVGSELSDDLDQEGTTTIDANFDIQVEGFMYKPVSTSNLVNVINTNYFIADTSANTVVNSFSTSGFSAISDIPTTPSSAWETSGYNIANDVYFTHSDTTSGDYGVLYE